MEKEINDILPCRPSDLKELAAHIVAQVITPDDMHLAYQMLASASQQVKEIKEKLEKKAIDILDNNGGSVTIGDIRYYIGEPKETKCKDAKTTLHRLIEELQGDEGAVAACLSANAWKYGEIKSRLEEVGSNAFEELFETKTKKTVETGKTKVNRIDLKFTGEKNATRGQKDSANLLANTPSDGGD